MRIALAFQQWDVDLFLQNITHEQFCEWREFFSVEPFGWEALRIVTARLSYINAQAHSKKQLREKSFDLRLSSMNSAAVEEARAIAESIRQNVRVKRQARKHG